MKKFLLCCSAGMTASLLTKNMRDYITKTGDDIEVKSCPVDEIFGGKAEVDVILLSPQVRYHATKVKTLYPNTPSVLIPIKEFGRMDGEAIVKLGKSLLK